MQFENYDLWEELVFGNSDGYRRICQFFPHKAEFLATSSDVGARRVVRDLMREMREAVFSDMDMPGFFGEMLKDIIESRMKPPNEDITEQVVEALRDDLSQPDELPVEWPE